MEDGVEVVLVVVIKKVQEGLVAALFTEDFVELQERKGATECGPGECPETNFVILILKNEIIRVVNDILLRLEGVLTELLGHLAQLLDSVRSYFVVLIFFVLKPVISLA